VEAPSVDATRANAVVNRVALEVRLVGPEELLPPAEVVLANISLEVRSLLVTKLMSLAADASVDPGVRATATGASATMTPFALPKAPTRQWCVIPLREICTRCPPGTDGSFGYPTTS